MADQGPIIDVTPEPDRSGRAREFMRRLWHGLGTILRRFIRLTVRAMTLIGLMFLGAWGTQRYQFDWFGFIPARDCQTTVAASTMINLDALAQAIVRKLPPLSPPAVDTDRLASKVVEKLPSMPMNRQEWENFGKKLGTIEESVGDLAKKLPMTSTTALESSGSKESASSDNECAKAAEEVKATAAKLVTLSTLLGDRLAKEEAPASVSPPVVAASHTEPAKHRTETREGTCPDPEIVRTRPEMLDACLSDYEERRAAADAKLRRLQDVIGFLTDISRAYERKVRRPYLLREKRKFAKLLFIMSDFLKKVVFWTWTILEMIIETVQYIIQMAAEVWFAAVIIIFLLVAWYFGVFR